MRNRFFVDAPLAPESVVALDHEERHHARVLRVREGEEVEVFDGRGGSYLAIYESADSIRLIREVPGRESRLALHLAMAIIQLDKFELVLQKSTELGVRTIIPLVTERGEVRAERIGGKMERWRKIVLEAVKQCGRSRIPVIEPVTSYDDAIRREGNKILFDAESERSATQQPSNPATLFIGPEGGWSDDELRRAREQQCAFERLGPRRLRAETAAIVALALIAARSGDI
jgi:16S rRNA (uracil1498-N3)-methyltransferase